MQSLKHRPGKVDMLFQHTAETNHRLGTSDMLSHHAQYRQAIPACIAKKYCIKEAAKPKTVDKLTQQNNCRNRRDLHKRNKQLQYLRRLGKRHEA